MIKLWNQTMPHRCVEDAFEPYLTPYDCDAAKTAIVVCPGGAYCGRADYEGNDVGAWLNTIGITAFVLEYRVAPSKAPAQPSDAQRAMRLARKLCMERGIERLGIMGFSAGGHLAATLSVHYDEAFYPPQDELDNLSACPDFSANSHMHRSGQLAVLPQGSGYPSRKSRGRADIDCECALQTRSRRCPAVSCS